MAVAEALREELAAIAPERRCDRLAELSGLLHTAGSASLQGGGRVGVRLDLGSTAAARRAFSVLRSLALEPELRTYRSRRFDRPTRYQLTLAAQAHGFDVLREAGALGAAGAPLDQPPPRVIARRCCRAAYLRGALLGAGSLSGPRAPHLEIRAGSVAGARFLARVAHAAGAHLDVAERRGHALAYAKGRDAVAAVLAAAGASDAVLALEERGVLAATRNRANRLANADHANLARTAGAAHVQLAAARLLLAQGELDSVPGPLAEAARLRLRHPTLSLRELAMRCDPPATKATLHRRLRKLVALAELAAPASTGRD